MSILDRILLIILSIGALCAAVFGLLFGIGALNASTVAGSVSSFPVNVYVAVISIIFGLIAIRFFFYRWSGRSRSPEVVILPGDGGNIRISFETIKQLANRTGKSIRGVQEFDTRVRSGQTGIHLAVRVRALPDIDLAQMSADIQEAVKTYIERTTGIAVEYITVFVAELASNTPKSSRVWVE